MTNYEDYPIVKLKRIIENEEWFKLADGEYTCAAENQKIGGYVEIPDYAILKITYKEHVINISIDTHYRNPNTLVIHPYKSTREFRRRNTSDVQKAAKIIKEFLITVTDDVEVEIKEEAEKQVTIKQNENRAAQLSEHIGAKNIEYNKETNEQYVEFKVKLSKNHAVRFHPDVRNQGNYFVQINGSYSVDSLKTIFNAITDCPEPMADRLANGK